MSETNRQLLLKERPTGRVGQQNFDLVEEPVPEIGDGEALVRKHENDQAVTFAPSRFFL